MQIYINRFIAWFCDFLRPSKYRSFVTNGIYNSKFFLKSFQNRHQELQQKATNAVSDVSDLKQRPKSEEENIELKVVEEERLENEPSNLNSPKQIKSLNHSDEEKGGLECEISMAEDAAPEEVKPNPKPKSAVTNYNSEGSTKETHNQPTICKQIGTESNMNVSPSNQKLEIRVVEDDTNFVERRYCTKCNQDQVIRSKHCKYCQRCVACYDHHCPWVGNCIGEKNKCPFYWFVLFQLVQIVAVSITIYETIDISSEYFSDNLYMVPVLLTIAFFLVMVFSLLIYHTYLAMVNLTTCRINILNKQGENVSWHKISYLKDFPERIGSPFNRGIIRNLQQFCRFRVQRITLWGYNQEALTVLKQ